MAAFITHQQQTVAGQQGSYYEGGIRVPLIINGLACPRRGGLSPNRLRAQISTPPVLSRRASLATEPAPGWIEPAAVDFRQRLSRSSRLFWHYPHYSDHPNTFPASVVRKGPWKLIESFDPEGVELYNLAEDIGETRNLASEQKALAGELRRSLMHGGVKSTRT